MPSATTKVDTLQGTDAYIKHEEKPWFSGEDKEGMITVLDKAT